MKALLSGLLLGVLWAMPAQADYTLTCQTASGGYTDISVAGAGGFDDACARIASDPAYGSYGSCIDAGGQRGICPTTARASAAQTLLLQSKSFIAAFDLNDPGQFDPGWFGAPHCRQALMGAVVTCGINGGENPFDGESMSGNFRLRSEVRVDASCSGNSIMQWNIVPVAVETGTEFFVFTTTGEFLGPYAHPAPSGSGPVDEVTFEYFMRGKPNIVGNAAMWAAKPRTCTYIWHSVQGSLSCSNGALVDRLTYNGSQFPSHRVWKNRMTLVADMPQGPFKNLWVCAPSDPDYVQ
jgi:hypothetical protein